MSTIIDRSEVRNKIKTELDVLTVVRDRLRDLEFDIQDKIDSVTNAEDEQFTALTLETAADELSKYV